MTECTCHKATKRIGEVHNRNGNLLYRFDMDCPVHGIIVHQKEIKEDVEERNEDSCGQPGP